MNWSDLQDRVLLPFHNVDNGLRVAARKYLIEAQEDLIRETGCLERNKWFYLDTDTEYVTLPDDFIDVSRVEFKGYLLDPLQVSERISFHYHTSTPTYRFAKTEKYYLDGNRLYLFPGSSSAGWLVIYYIYRPNVLDDDATKYRKLDYDGLVKHFVQGETVTGGTTFATGKVEFDDNHMTTGTLILSGVSGTFVDDETLTGDTQTATQATQNVLDSALAQVQDSDLNDVVVVTGVGFALANGADRAFLTAGDNPDIDLIYRPYLADYARAIIWQDKGFPSQAEQHLARWYQNRQKVIERFSNREMAGAEKISEDW